MLQRQILIDGSDFDSTLATLISLGSVDCSDLNVGHWMAA